MRRHLLALIMMFSGLLLSAQNIYNGQDLQQNRKYWSANKQYYLIFQNDGNLVFYNRAGSSIWASKTQGRGVKASFQDDGNLVVYAPRNGVAFTSNTSGKRANRLAVQDDGNLVIYSNSNALWASKNGSDNGNGNGWGFRGGYLNPGHKFTRGSKVFSANRNYYLAFQNDGNLVLSNNNGDPVWGAGTDNKGSRAEFQNDGNLVVYDSYNRAVWTSNTSNRGATRLDIQDDGNLVIYAGSSPVWSSGTQRY